MADNVQKSFQRHTVTVPVKLIVSGFIRPLSSEEAKDMLSQSLIELEMHINRGISNHRGMGMRVHLGEPQEGKSASAPSVEN